jgi:hypothetical protein
VPGNGLVGAGLDGNAGAGLLGNEGGGETGANGPTSSTIEGNCTRCADAGADANKQSVATMPRSQQAVNGVSGFKLGTEFVARGIRRPRNFFGGFQ